MSNNISIISETPGFVVIQIQQHFHFCPDWYRQGEAGALGKQYYVVLRSVLRSRPDLRRCLSRCRIRCLNTESKGQSDLLWLLTACIGTV